jgi:peptidoglycan-associated lipoprotein
MLLILSFIVILLSCGQTTIEEDLPKDLLNVVLIDEETFSREPPIHEREVITGPFETVFFQLGGVVMSRDAVLAIRKNAIFLSKNANVNVILEGYCDNSGTTAYNLALGQKRALEVKRLYTLLGIKADRIATISYGNENPISKKPALNRRVETKILTDRLIMLS